MTRPGSSRRNAVAMSFAWWYLRRLLRKRGTAAVAGLVSGHGLSLARRPSKRHPIRWLLVLGLLAGGGVLWRRRRQGGGDDWGGWEPGSPVSPPPPGRATEPTPKPGPGTAPVSDLAAT